MDYKKLGDRYVIKLEPGDEVLSCVEEVCEEEDITAASFEGIGAAGDIEIAYFDKDEEEYLPKRLDDDSYEITSLTGNVGGKDGDVILHAHVVVGDRDHNAYTGHLNHSVISVTFEIVLVPMEGNIERTRQDFGLDMWDL